MPPARQGKSRKRLLGTAEYGKLHDRSDSRIRQLILEDRIWPRPRKVGNTWAIDATAIILRPPEREYSHSIFTRAHREELTDTEVGDLVAESRYWIEREVE